MTQDAGDPVDLSDSQGRDALRSHRDRFGRAGYARPESFYLNRWIPSPSHTGSWWDSILFVVGAVMIAAVVAAVVIFRVIN